MHESNFPRKENNINSEYKFFDQPERRHDIYEFSKGVTAYLHDEKVPNIILIDRSPRPIWVGIDEYWKQNYKDEQRPNIYFVNPEGFNSVKMVMEKENMPEEDLLAEQI